MQKARLWRAASGRAEAKILIACGHRVQSLSKNMKLLLRNLFVSCAALCALLMVWSGCATDGATPNANAAQFEPDAGNTNVIDAAVIRAGEQLTIELLDINPPAKIEQSVADDGTITLPLLSERVPVAGKKVAETQDMIHDLYVPRYYRRMTVNIKRENRYRSEEHTSELQ